MPRPVDAESEPEVDSSIQQQTRPIPLPFPTRTPLARKSKTNEDLLKMLRKVEINIPILDRKKIKGGAETGGVMLALVQNKGAITGSQSVLPKKCGNPRIFSVPCTIGKFTFVDVMLDLGASINIISALVYKSLNFKDLELTGMTIQLANRSVVQPLGTLKDVLVEINHLIFPIDFYVLDMEDETSGKGSALILGCLFLMIAKTKIDHPTEDHSLFGIDVIDKLVEEHT
ncbi:hypothetical protein CR513_40949, partial [Mucuna pruriens]